VLLDLDNADESWLEQWLQAKLTILSPGLQELRSDNLPLKDRFTGRVLAEALEIRGLSRSKLAEYLSLDRSMVTYWIKGARLIQPKHREQICELLGPELEQVLQRA
jgi:ribosome-binding protein aMBF1 (putative translation factor)